MALITWNDNFSIKIDSIDNQHKELVRIINELHEAMGAGKAKDILSSVFDNLVSYTQTHFATEEKYFDEFQYPNTESHKKEHQALINKASELQAEFKSGKLMISLDIMNFLKDWLTNHIQKIDKEYSSFLLENGVK